MPTRLLLIEDNPGDALIFRERLSESDLDYELVHTQRLAEGLRLLEGEQFDLILVDLSLPDASGVEAVAQVIDAAPDRPVIVLTGLDDATTAAEARERGAIDYLVKWYHDGPSLARYVRYAIAQVQRQSKASDVEGEGEGTSEDAGAPTPPEAMPSTVPAPSPDNGEGSSALRDALERAAAGIVVVSADRTIRYANRLAREWLGDTRLYPTQAESGYQRITVQEEELVADAVTTQWDGEEALLLALRRPSRSRRSAVTLETAEAALAFIAQSERGSRWMANIVRMSLELEQSIQRGIEGSPTLIDLVERTQMVARELHDLSMERGRPVHVRASREKISVRADRQALESMLRRLLHDAVVTAGGSNVDVEIAFHAAGPTIEVAWELSLAEWASVPAPVRALSRQLLERLVERAGGGCAHREEGGKDVITVTFPAGAT